MPDPVPAVPAAPAAAVPPASTTPPATPPAAPATPPASGADPKATGRGTRLFSLLAAEAETPPGSKPAEVKKPDAAPTPAPDGKDPKAAASATPAPAATPNPDDPPIRATKKSPISKRPELPKETPVTPATPAAATTPAPSDVDWEKELVDEERQFIAEAQEAEQFLPNKKGFAEQAKRFVREHQKYLEKHTDLDDPDEKAAYEAWLAKNRPALSAADQRTITENRIAAKVSKPLEQKTQDLEHQLYVREQEPVLQKQTQRVVSELNTSAMPDEIMDFAQKYGVETAKKEFADELAVVNTIVSTAASDYEELIRLDTFHPITRRPLSSPAMNESDPKFAQHQRLLGIMDKVDTEFKETAKQNELMRDGKWFVTREEWRNMPANARGQFWHFTNREIATRMLTWVKPAIDITITNNRKSLEARGYERRKFVPPAAAPAAPATPPQPTRTPSGPGASPVPAAPASSSPQTTGSRLASALAGG